MVRANGTGEFPNSTLALTIVARKYQDADGYYELLGVDPRSTEAEIKRAAKRRLMETHPDVGGDEDDFCKVMQAYQTLSDQTLKAEYDRKEKLPKGLHFKRKATIDLSETYDAKPFGFYKNMTDILLDSDVEMLYNWLDAVMDAAHEFRWEADIKVGIGGEVYTDQEGIAVMPKGAKGKDHRVMAKLFVLKRKCET